MKFALVQPNWDFAQSVYFGCRDTHLPLELLFAAQQLRAAGHEALIVDGHLEALPLPAASGRVAAYAPDFLIITTAPSYLFWRCPQPELRVPAQWMRGLLAAVPGCIGVAIGPHGSATPAATARKLGATIVMRGEPDQTLGRLASEPLSGIPGCCWHDAIGWHQSSATSQADLAALPALAFDDYPLALRRHRHHVFAGHGRGLELEHSRGCPWACNFCNKTLFRNRFRERGVDAVLAEAEAAVRAGFQYVYFIDEIFGCGPGTAALLDGLAQLPLAFGVQTRIDLWNEDSLARLGRAHCISLECGVEAVDAEGRARLRKGCRLDTARISTLLRCARRHIPWVQANLIAGADDDREAVQAWRQQLIAGGVWVSQPVPVFAFPGTPLYRRLFGEPDDQAWERAHASYLTANAAVGYSDIQDASPQPLAELESSDGAA